MENFRDDPNETQFKMSEKKTSIWLKIILWLIFAVIVGGATYYFVNKKAKTDKNNLQSQIDDLNKKIADANTASTAAQTATTTTTTATPTTSATTTTPTPATTSWKKYSNTAYGFSLTFPNDYWKDYAFIAKTPSDSSETKSLYFCLTSTDKTWNDGICTKGSGAPLAIGVYTKAQWSVIVNDDTPEVQMKIGENATYVFTLSHWQDGPADLLALNLDFESISASFKAN